MLDLSHLINGVIISTQSISATELWSAVVGSDAPKQMSGLHLVLVRFKGNRPGVTTAGFVVQGKSPAARIVYSSKFARWAVLPLSDEQPLSLPKAVAAALAGLFADWVGSAAPESPAPETETTNGESPI